jgi:hypothetical protein
LSDYLKKTELNSELIDEFKKAQMLIFPGFNLIVSLKLVAQQLNIGEIKAPPTLNPHPYFFKI